MEHPGTILESLAGLLDYPDSRVGDRAVGLGRAAAGSVPAASLALDDFRAFASRSRPGDIEEAYSLAFDFEPSTCLAVGYHLFGDTPRRGMFLAGLKSAFRSAGFEAEGELPDHLPTLLRFLARLGPSDERTDLVDRCVVPAASAIRRGLDAKKHPYARVLEALLMFLAEEKRGEAGDKGP